MPITKSAKKSLANSQKKRVHNLTLEKKLEIAIKKADEKNFTQVISLIDKAAKRNFIHKNKAARLKSRINKKFASVKVVKKTAPVSQATAKTSSKKTAKKSSTKPKTSSKK